MSFGSGKRRVEIKNRVIASRMVMKSSIAQRTRTSGPIRCCCRGSAALPECIVTLFHYGKGNSNPTWTPLTPTGEYIIALRIIVPLARAFQCMAMGYMKTAV
jgi:hypothetical protein